MCAIDHQFIELSLSSLKINIYRIPALKKQSYVITLIHSPWIVFDCDGFYERFSAENWAICGVVKLTQRVYNGFSYRKV